MVFARYWYESGSRVRLAGGPADDSQYIAVSDEVKLCGKVNVICQVTVRCVVRYVERQYPGGLLCSFEEVLYVLWAPSPAEEV